MLLYFSLNTRLISINCLVFHMFPCSGLYVPRLPEKSLENKTMSTLLIFLSDAKIVSNTRANPI